jgi:hypothetical protein
MTQTAVDISEFARKVEGLCDFLLSKFESVDGSPDVKVIQDLKESAADIHMGGTGNAEVTLSGLDAYMRGLPETS